MKWALVAIGIGAALLVAVVIIGVLQPRDPVVAMTAHVNAPPAAAM